MKYRVVFEKYTERYFIKSFSRKYKGAWDKTLKGLYLEFTFPQLLFLKTIAEEILISKDGDIKICKTEFKIVGTEVSRHASGNRCIVAIHETEKTVKVLLIYHKSDIVKSGNETVAWKQIIKENFPEYDPLL
ncbi:MAG: hypothetical protein RL538_386 [Candidatus Parcubacteria bacterium]|jgi:hypothetical protein